MSFANHSSNQFCREATPLYSTHDAFKTAMHNAGLVSDVSASPDGRIHRFKSYGDRNKDSWYVFYGDGGAFGNWRTGLRENWFRGDVGKHRKSEIRKEIRATQIAAREKKNQENRAAALTARTRWVNATPIKDAQMFPYLERKKVRSFGLRSEGSNILIPMCNNREVWSIQTIKPNGDKRFQYQGRVSGCYFHIGTPGCVIWLAEGYATAATVFEATGECTVVSFSAGNLVNVAKNIRNRYRMAQIYIAADNDTTGLSKADEAVIKHQLGGRVSPTREAGATDWNDYFNRYGIDMTRSELLAVTQ